MIYKTNLMNDPVTRPKAPKNPCSHNFNQNFTFKFFNSFVFFF